MMLWVHTDVLYRELVIHDLSRPLFPRISHIFVTMAIIMDDIGQAGTSEARIEDVFFQRMAYITPECSCVAYVTFLEPNQVSGASAYLKKSLLGLPPTP